MRHSTCFLNDGSTHSWTHGHVKLARAFSGISYYFQQLVYLYLTDASNEIRTGLKNSICLAQGLYREKL